MCVRYRYAHGVRTYFGSTWNILDSVLVTSALLGLLAIVFPQLEFLTTLRILRTLRPLRLLMRDPGMRVVI